MTFDPKPDELLNSVAAYTRIPKSLETRIKKEAKENGLTASSFIKQCIEYAISNMDKGK